ncbi:MAG: purine-nucleoside phosphorylase [Bacillales bacterium]|nr:purine-nucleoside phosphorylase [Bacillales bacterium]
MTPHINALEGEIAKVVIMPGDPLRAKYIAENYLKDYKLVNTVRNIYAYTGYYNDKLVTVMASGMGMPSIGIYSYELYKFYNVEKIIRIGTCGVYTDKVKLFDVILVNNAYSDSSFAKVQNGYNDNIISASKELNNKIKETGKNNNIDLVEGTIYSSDVFYKENDNYEVLRDKYNCLGVEMESFALFSNAKVLNKEAACLLTVTDHFITKEKASSTDREKSLNKMIELALKSI